MSITTTKYLNEDIGILISLLAKYKGERGPSNKDDWEWNSPKIDILLLVGAMESFEKRKQHWKTFQHSDLYSTFPSTHTHTHTVWNSFMSIGHCSDCLIMLDMCIFETTNTHIVIFGLNCTISDMSTKMSVTLLATACYSILTVSEK